MTLHLYRIGGRVFDRFPIPYVAQCSDGEMHAANTLDLFCTHTIKMALFPSRAREEISFSPPPGLDALGFRLSEFKYKWPHERPNPEKYLDILLGGYFVGIGNDKDAARMLLGIRRAVYPVFPLDILERSAVRASLRKILTEGFDAEHLEWELKRDQHVLRKTRVPP